MNARVEAAAKAAHKHDFGHSPSCRWEDSSVQLQADYAACATAALTASDAVMFSPANIAEVVRTTGLSIQTVTEVIRTLAGNRA